MTRAILVPSARKGPDQSCWDDLRVALQSIKAYAPGVETIVAYSGPKPEDLPWAPEFRLLRQPDGTNNGGDAWNFCASHTDADELIIFSDDAVLHPDTIRLFDEDLAYLDANGVDMGMVGARSNFVKGAQNVRASNGGKFNGMAFDTEELLVMNVPMIVPICAWIAHEIFDKVGGFPPLNWFGDDVLGFDLIEAGRTNVVSRAYVHHIGQRSTPQSPAEQIRVGLAWLAEHRPVLFEIARSLYPSDSFVGS